MADGFSISVTRTIAVEATSCSGGLERSDQEALAAGHHAALAPDPRRMDVPLRLADPPSRIVFTVIPKAPGKSLVAVAHEKLPDAEAAEGLKTAWRGWFGDLKTLLERP